MKKHHAFAAVAASCAAVPAAYAQSSVTLYGITDVGIDRKSVV